jgi:Uma2 family endonuclease
MNNPTDFHEKIVGNVGAQLKVVTDQRQCHVFFGGLRVQRSDDARAGDKPRPDLLVRCGPLTGKTYATDPLVVVEVLSPSTFDLDRGDKLAFYKSLSTMRHIVFVYQDQMRVEHYRRNDAGWPIEVLMRPQDRLVLDAVTFETILDAVYDGVPVGF